MTLYNHFYELVCLFFLSRMYTDYLSIIVIFWCCEAFSVGGSVGGASHARQRPMRTLELH